MAQCLATVHGRRIGSHCSNAGSSRASRSKNHCRWFAGSLVCDRAAVLRRSTGYLLPFLAVASVIPAMLLLLQFATGATTGAPGHLNTSRLVGGIATAVILFVGSRTLLARR